MLQAGGVRALESRVSEGRAASAPVASRPSFGRALAFALALAAVAPGSPAAEIALRVRANGRIDLRVTSAPLSAVLDRLARETGVELVYQGARPQRVVSLEVYGSDQARTVLEVLDRLAVNYAVSFDAEGTRVRKIVIDDSAAAAHTQAAEQANQGRAAETEPAAPAPLPQESAPEMPSASEDGPNASFPLLPADYQPGRANRQTPDGNMSGFELPDPPDGKAPSESPSQPDRVAPTPEPAATPSPQPTAEPSPAPLL
jgi:hypothetical protein